MVPETGLHSLTNVTGVRTGVRPQAIRAYRGTHASPRCSVQRPLGEENLNIHRDFALYIRSLHIGSDLGYCSLLAARLLCLTCYSPPLATSRRDLISLLMELFTNVLSLA